MQKNAVTINGKEYPIFCSTEAYSEIGKICGGKIEEITNILKSEDKTVEEKIRFFGSIIEALINGAIKRKNFAIEAGFEDGEEKNLFPSGGIFTLSHPMEIISVKNKAAVLNAIAGSTIYEVPDDVNLTKKEVDLDLEEIREANAKKAESAE